MREQGQVAVRVVGGEADWRGALAVRHAVFVIEQSVPLELERDDLDASAVHVVAASGGEVVGTARLTRETELHIGRVAVLPSWRRRGIAGMLVSALEAEARRLGGVEVSLHSQSYVRSLYAKLGYEASGAPFVEAGIEHVLMRKRLA